MDILLVVLAGVLILLGIIGCVIPMLPGTPLCYLGIIMLHFSCYAEFSVHFFVRWGVIIILVQGLDYYIPIWGGRRFGGSKKGVWGSVVGMLAGLFLGPFGILLGAMAGAFIGELLAGKASSQAIKAAFGSFLGFILGTISQLVVAGCLLFYYCKALSYAI
jgi:uncharacterized protein